jgi:hypothetical protein
MALANVTRSAVGQEKQIVLNFIEEVFSETAN